MCEKEPLHTFMDDIKYQMVKEDNKRTPFYCSEVQIQAKCKRTLEKIEKKKKLVTSEFHRQHLMLESQLDKLLKTKRDLGLVGSKERRRHSVPSNLLLASHVMSPCQIHGVESSRRDLIGHSPTNNEIQSKRSDLIGHSSANNDTEKSSLPKRVTKQSLPDIRRMSHDFTDNIQQNTSMTSQSNFIKGRRRATIAEGTVSKDLFSSLNTGTFK
ncbi:hypothetical protein BgiBS90_012072 [Biomphalaria glabrata]|nr:hypothetical protein BgiBS90_012072 [Biomphalaria glabrata]